MLGLDALYVSRHSGPWNWKNGDLLLLDWYREAGHRLSFDVLHFLEWDLLLAEPLERLYAAVPPQAVGLTAPTPLSVIGDDWRWTMRRGRGAGVGRSPGLRPGPLRLRLR